MAAETVFRRYGCFIKRQRNSAAPQICIANRSSNRSGGTSRPCSSETRQVSPSPSIRTPKCAVWRSPRGNDFAGHGGEQCLQIAEQRFRGRIDCHPERPQGVVVLRERGKIRPIGLEAVHPAVAPRGPAQFD